MSRRQLCLGGLVAVVLAACEKGVAPSLTPSPTSPGSTPPTPSPSASSSASSSASPSSVTSTSPQAWPALTDRGQARAVVDELVGEAGLPVIKVDITSTSATLSALEGRRARAWRWAAGRIDEVPSDIAYIEQASFDPSDFNIDDVGALFRTAAEISGSSLGQELQIVEQTPGSVLMVVTTRPESEPVFFRPDATAVNRLDFTTRPGLEEGLRDAVAGRTQLTSVSLGKATLAAESAHPKDNGATLRVSRPARIPAFHTSRQERPALGEFSPTDVPVGVILQRVTSLPLEWNQPAGGEIAWVIDRRDNRPLPTIRFSMGTRTMVTDLTGRDITHEV